MQQDLKKQSKTRLYLENFMGFNHKEKLILNQKFVL